MPNLVAEPISALAGTRVLSLALNLPGPAALMRCQRMGATCIKLEPPAPASAPEGASADPMQRYAPHAFAALHEGVERQQADLKSAAGRETLEAELALADVLLTSFRPSALARLGLDWDALHARHPRLSMVAIVGAPGERAEEPGHDLTYLAEAGLVPGCELPATLFADTAGSVMASEAVLQALLHRATHGVGMRIEVALSDAARYLAMPLDWGLTAPAGAVGGAHAGYKVYRCADGRVAMAALEPHFAASLAAVAGLDKEAQGANAAAAMFRSSTHVAVAAFVASLSCGQLESLAREHDLPFSLMPDDDLLSNS